MGWSSIPFSLFRTLLQPKTTHLSGILLHFWSATIKTTRCIELAKIIVRVLRHKWHSTHSLSASSAARQWVIESRFSTTLKIHRKFRFWPKTKIFVPFCSELYKDLFKPNIIFGFIGTLISHLHVLKLYWNVTCLFRIITVPTNQLSESRAMLPQSHFTSLIMLNFWKLQLGSISLISR